MEAPPFQEVQEVLEFRANQVYELLEEFKYEFKRCTPQELYQYLVGESKRDPSQTFRDRLGNEYLLLHTIIEISELKEAGLEVNEETPMKAPPEKLLDAHLKATDYELGYSLILEDYYWLKHRLAHLGREIKAGRYSGGLREKALEIYRSLLEYKDY